MDTMGKLEECQKFFFEWLIQMFPNNRSENSWQKMFFNSLVNEIKIGEFPLIEEADKRKFEQSAHQLNEWQEKREHLAALEAKKFVIEGGVEEKREKEMEKLVLWKSKSERSELEDIFRHKENWEALFVVLDRMFELRENVEFRDKSGGDDFFKIKKLLKIIARRINRREKLEKIKVWKFLKKKKQGWQSDRGNRNIKRGK